VTRKPPLRAHTRIRYITIRFSRADLSMPATGSGHFLASQAGSVLNPRARGPQVDRDRSREDPEKRLRESGEQAA
jgi:hypothetical protein